MTRLRRLIASAFCIPWLCASAVLLLTGCSVPEATIQLGGSLSILPTGSSFNTNALPDDWFTRGRIPDNTVAGSSSLVASTLSVSSAKAPFLVARRVTANVLATPYLSWRWRMEPGKWQYHPVRIVIGFVGGGDEPPKKTIVSRLFPATAIPAYNRVISLIWAPSALMRGTLVQLSSQNQLREAQYMVRGGPENVGKWWPETVDLASLYQRSWPADQISQIRIAFIGISSTGTPSPFKMYLADLRISR